MAIIHKVKEGEHIPGIADANGFNDYLTIWNDGANSELKQSRKNPNVLFAGDQVTVKERDPSEFDRPVDQLHKFVVKDRPLKLRVKLEELYGQVLANTPVRLTVGSSSANVTTDGNGLIDQTIDKQAVSAKVIVPEKTMRGGATITVYRELPLMIGYLDPVEEYSGKVQRLTNLGYLLSGELDSEQMRFRSAVEEFQCENALQVTGNCDAATEAALLKVHGC